MIRHTRGEEETDRAELVRAAPVGRLGDTGRACVWVAIINAVVAVGLTLSLLAFGLTTTGTLAFGAACCGIGMVFIGVAAVTAQIASSARAANGDRRHRSGHVVHAASGRRPRYGLGDLALTARLGPVDPGVRRRAVVGARSRWRSRPPLSSPRAVALSAPTRPGCRADATATRPVRGKSPSGDPARPRRPPGDERR